MLFEVLGLPDDVKHAIHHTRYNDKPLLPSTRDTFIGDPNKGGYYKNGHELTKQPDGTYHLVGWTVVRAQHVLNYGCTVDTNLNIIEGVVNTFSWGYMPIDQDYLDEYINEWRESPIEWDSHE